MDRAGWAAQVVLGSVGGWGGKVVEVSQAVRAGQVGRVHIGRMAPGRVRYTRQCVCHT